MRFKVAIYARYSTDKQREASIEDQLRNVERYAAREGWTITHRFQDAGLSGTKRDRPGYQAMLAAARRREFEVLLVDDLSRISRDDVELKQTIRRFQFAGLRIIGVSDGFDTATKGHKIQATVRGMMNEIALDDLADKTHRGLTGQALKGFNAGGRSYGYRHVPIEDPTRRDEYGRPVITAVRREVDQDQAEVVRLIFDLFIAGKSARAIACELNRKKIKSPRGGAWRMSAIYGDRRSGVGILNNPLYNGEVIWNRSRWIREPDTGKRRRRERDASEWIRVADESLRIVTPKQWADAQKRLARRTHKPGPKPRHLLSGILRCGVCGGAFVKVDRYRYGCATHRDAGACANGMKVAMAIAERELLAGIKRDLMSPEAQDLFRREVAALLRAERARSQPSQARVRLAAIEREAANLVNAIKAGADLPPVRAALADLEAERQRLEAEIAAAANLAALPDFIPRAGDLYRAMVADLEDALRQDPEAAQERLRDILGDEIPLVPIPTDQALEARLSHGVARLAMKLAAGGELTNVVAGAGSGHWYTVRLPASGRVA